MGKKLFWSRDRLVKHELDCFGLGLGLKRNAICMIVCATALCTFWCIMYQNNSYGPELPKITEITNCVKPRSVFGQNSENKHFKECVAL